MMPFTFYKQLPRASFVNFDRMKKSLLLFCLLWSLVPGWSQEKEIRALIDKMFQSMYKGDTATLRTCFTPVANFMTYSFDSKGNPRAKGEALNDFLRGIALAGEADMEERLTGWQCLVDGGIASVWAPYEFVFESKFSHCGVNSFQLIKVQGEWRISMITDTRRKKNCIDDDATIRTIDSLVNDWHFAATIADEEMFFGRMTSDAVYIGTDPTERWLCDELKEWSKPYFSKESAWDFKPLSRQVTIGPGGQIAWFDELLDTWMGPCRSTGIMELHDGEWKIVYYHLSVAVPNDKIQGYKSLIGKS